MISNPKQTKKTSLASAFSLEIFTKSNKKHDLRKVNSRIFLLKN
jgi:hypothetical protein